MSDKFLHAIKKISIILNTSAWVLLMVSLVFNWAIVTQRVDIPGHDQLTRVMDAARGPR